MALINNKFWIHPWPSGEVKREEALTIIRTYALEKSLKKQWGLMTPVKKAKCLVALAYDCCGVYAEQVAERYLVECLNICPDYFQVHIYKDANEDETFKKIIDQLKVDFPEIFVKI